MLMLKSKRSSCFLRRLEARKDVFLRIADDFSLRDILGESIVFTL